MIRDYAGVKAWADKAQQATEAHSSATCINGYLNILFGAQITPVVWMEEPPRRNLNCFRIPPPSNAQTYCSLLELQFPLIGHDV